MAVSDPQNLLGLEFPPPEKKYIDLRRMFYLEGNPNLKGSLSVRVFDSLLLRSFGLLIGFGKKGSDPESEYNRLTGNFRRMGNIGRLMGHLGPLGRWLLGLNFRAYASMLVRQGICEVEKRTNHVEAAKDYLKIIDLFNFKAVVCGKDDHKVEYKLPECPLGYGQGDDVRVCMASMEFDNQCIRRLGGGRSILKEKIPGGGRECLVQVVPVGS
jgi:hypothetical protein